MWILVLQRLTLEFFLDFLYFPIWWYTLGLKKAIIFCYSLFQGGNYYLAPFLWLKNLFVPMFGQTDFGGRLMSVFMRFVNVVGRGVALLVWMVICILLLSVWFLFPVFLFYIFFNFSF